MFSSFYAYEVHTGGEAWKCRKEDYFFLLDFYSPMRNNNVAVVLMGEATKVLVRHHQRKMIAYEVTPVALIL